MFSALHSVTEESGADSSVYAQKKRKGKRRHTYLRAEGAVRRRKGSQKSSTAWVTLLLCHRKEEKYSSAPVELKGKGESTGGRSLSKKTT